MKNQSLTLNEPVFVFLGKKEKGVIDRKGRKGRKGRSTAFLAVGKAFS